MKTQNKNQDIPLAIVPDVVCPICFKPLTCPTIVGEITDRYKRTIRTYFGWCFECNKGCEVIQFRRDKRFIIHKYRLKEQAGENDYVMNTWQIINDMPKPPSVLLGPGGDYDRPANPFEIEVELLKNMKTITTSMTGAIDNLLKMRGVDD